MDRRVARNAARDFAVYGVVPGVLTVAALVAAGWSSVVPLSTGVLVLVVLHVAAVGLLLFGRTARERNLDYGEHAYNAATTDATDMEAVVGTGAGSTPGLKRKAFLWSVATLPLSAAVLVVLYVT